MGFPEEMVMHLLPEQRERPLCIPLQEGRACELGEHTIPWQSLGEFVHQPGRADVLEQEAAHEPHRIAEKPPFVQSAQVVIAIFVDLRALGDQEVLVRAGALRPNGRRLQRASCEAGHAGIAWCFVAPPEQSCTS